MKKFFFRLIILVSTFFIGLFFFTLLFFYQNPLPHISMPNHLPSPEKCPTSKSFPGLSKKIVKTQAGKSGYFPKDQFAGNYGGADDWYGEQLRAMKEVSLLKGSKPNAEIYRFLRLRAFQHPLFVRIERIDNSVKLFARELDSASDYSSGKILRSTEKDLSMEEFCKFLGLLDKSDFWNSKTRDGISGRDGAFWILEGVKDGHYHVVDRWSPDKGQFREACLYLLQLSGIDTEAPKSDLY